MPKTVVVTYSELDAYRQCPLKWALAYQQRWSKEAVEGGALSRGTLWHKVMEVHYLTIKAERTREDNTWLRHPSLTKQAQIQAAAVAAVVNSGLLGVGSEQTEQQELVQWMYFGHLTAYGIDLDWQILEVEQAGMVWLPTDRGGRSRFKLAYKIDMVILDHGDGQTKLVDHKSASNFSRKSEIDIDDQFGLYWWAKRLNGMRVACVIRSDARTQRNKSPMRIEDRFQRIPTHRSPAELSNIALDAYRTATQAYRAGGTIHSSPAPDRCTWRCDFLEAHLQMRKQVAAVPVILRDFGFEQREFKHREYARGEIDQ